MTARRNHKASYKIIADTGGNRYRFFCESSGAAVYTSEILNSEDWERNLEQAWEQGARQYLNQCRKCGKWVCNAMFNPDVLECVDCAPWEPVSYFCSRCGIAVAPSDAFCGNCGIQLRDGGEDRGQTA